MPIDDSALRSAADDLITAARREVPTIELALQAVERGLGMLTVETSIGPNGAISTLVVFDDGVTAARVLLTAGS